MNQLTGFGSRHFSIAMYIANRPDFAHYPKLAKLQPLGNGEIRHIIAHTGNHWRKIFNVYAKFMAALKSVDSSVSVDWRHYRDNYLLQSHSDEVLLFSPPDFNALNTVHIVAGKTYAAQLQLTSIVWLDRYFAVDPARRLIVCTYPDYRQLSDQRIKQLIQLVREIGA